MRGLVAYGGILWKIIPCQSSRECLFALSDAPHRIQGWLVIPGLDWHASEYVFDGHVICCVIADRLVDSLTLSFGGKSILPVRQVDADRP
jgi:hypothetical protein